MNEGFFTSDQLSSFEKRIPLPPVLTVKLPAPAAKVAPPRTYSGIPELQMGMDIECYINYFLVKFKRVSDGKIFAYEQTRNFPLDIKSIRSIINKYEIITFNGYDFDIPLLKLALTCVTNEELKKAANLLINEERMFNFNEVYNLPRWKNLRHIDVIELCPGILSLKIYGGRLHCKKMQDLPYPEDKVLTEDEMDNVSDYCDNDLDLLLNVFLELSPQIELRRSLSERYGIDLLSKSDAQIAEAVIVKEIESHTNSKIEKRPISKGTFLYTAPDFIKFNSKKLLDALDIVETKEFEINPKGRITMPEELSKLKIKFGSSTYKMGMGGLHSTEKTVYHIANEEYSLFDWDVDSYYPKIILNCELYPPQLGRVFLNKYGNIVVERLEAKANKDDVKAGSFKIVVNGSFGKLGSPYSALYAPELMIQVTVTGQLSLLMLIEMMEEEGISVLSGNTDGVLLYCHKSKIILMQKIIKRWEKLTGFTMGKSEFAGVYSRDVNNYIAIKKNGEVKLKGCFRPPGLDKAPENEICTVAMINYLKYGTPLEETIRDCTDIRKFVVVRSVNGGAAKDGVYLGKAIRWYYSTKETGFIKGLKYDDKVAATDGARPLMELPERFPDDIDYNYYVRKCRNMFDGKGMR